MGRSTDPDRPTNAAGHSGAKAKLQALGYKVPLECVWPVGARLSAEPDWWHDPEGWVNGIVENLACAWPLLAPAIDDALAPRGSFPRTERKSRGSTLVRQLAPVEPVDRCVGDGDPVWMRRSQPGERRNRSTVLPCPTDGFQASDGKTHRAARRHEIED